MFYWYLFELVVCLNHNFYDSNSFAFSCVDRITEGTSRIVSAIAKVVALSASEMTQFADQVRIRLISQLISGISRVLQKVNLFWNLDLDLNDLEHGMSSSDSFQRYSHNSWCFWIVIVIFY